MKARLAGVATAAASDEFNLAVVTPRHGAGRGRVWLDPAAAPGGKPLAHAQLVELLSQAGVRWVKYPLGSTAPARANAWPPRPPCRDALEGEGIEMVALLCKIRNSEGKASRGVYPRGYAVAESGSKFGTGLRALGGRTVRPSGEDWYPAWSGR